MLSFQNTGKNPNKLHDYLIANGCNVKQLTHDRKYDEEGNIVEEASVINIVVAAGQEDLCKQLVNQFMSQ